MRASNTRLILFEIARIGLATLLIYCVLVGLALMLVPPPSARKPIDTGPVFSTAFSTEPKLIYLSRSSLSLPGPKLVLLGASNVVIGLERGEVQKLIPHDTVYGMALGSANITEIRQVLDLAMSSLGPEGIKETTFAIGVWYGDFAPDRLAWTRAAIGPYVETDIDREKYRYGFSYQGLNGPIDRFSDRFVPLAVTAVYPLIVLDRTVRFFTDRLRRRYVENKEQITDEILNHRVMPEKARERQLAYFRDRMGTQLSDEQFVTLGKIIDVITARGGKIVLINLPIPHWHAAASPYQADYTKKLSQMVKIRDQQSNFKFLDLGELDADDNFYDEVHPRPRARVAWVSAFAKVVNAATAVPPRNP